MKKYIFILVILTTFFACKQNKETVNVVKDNFFILMERTPCFGKCPSYIIKIYTNGKVSYLGKTFSNPEGKHTTTLSKTAIEELKAKIKVIDFFNLQDKYDAQITDIPSCYITVNINNKTKKILDRVNAPKELRALEKMIENMVITDHLVKTEE